MLRCWKWGKYWILLYGRIVGNTDLLETAQQVLPLLELLDADDNLVSCSFSDFLLEKTFVSHFFLKVLLLKKQILTCAVWQHRLLEIIFKCRREGKVLPVKRSQLRANQTSPVFRNSRCTNNPDISTSIGCLSGCLSVVGHNVQDGRSEQHLQEVCSFPASRVNFSCILRFRIDSSVFKYSNRHLWF